MTKDKRLEEILGKVHGCGDGAVDCDVIQKAKAEILALVPKKASPNGKCDCVKSSDGSMTYEGCGCFYESYNEAIDATLEAFGAGHD